MPIYEFKCSGCGEFSELLLMKKNDDTAELKCLKCGSYNLERVISASNYSVGTCKSANTQQAGAQTRNCSSGTCTTYNIAGVD
ncbi:MAG: zinc ribbon domain-containing protein [Deltaproteobacteria bacterium]|nr:zinc ribbon domain-containing protein [Deltaproteobacteria bacterium]